MSLSQRIQTALQQAAELWRRWNAADVVTGPTPPARILAHLQTFLRQLNLNP